MKNIARDYYLTLEKLLKSIEVTDKKGQKLPFHEGVAEVAGLIEAQTGTGKKIIFIGNGASAAISSHSATDFWRNAGVKAMAFNDASLLTCISNDFGYKYVFKKPIEMFAESGDILVAISSSGRSENILCGAEAARDKGMTIITLSGFDTHNPLRKMGRFNFYVSASSYGYVEVIHHAICHGLLDIIVQNRSRGGKKHE